jgi:DNA recombination protein RmuC
MYQTLFALDGVAVTFTDALAGAVAAVLALLLVLVVSVARARGARWREAEVATERQRDLEARIASLAQSSAELNGRLGGVADFLGSRQADLARLMADRLDTVSARVGEGLHAHAETTGANLGQLNERLAVIDAAQARLTGMTEQVISLKDILSNKQSRGAFGQGRMEAIVRDALPPDAFDFQFTLSNRARPDCIIRLPGDARPVALDAKFPLEALTLLKDARSEEARKAAAARVRADVSKHVRDIAERYLLPGETQDFALMFVPSESVFCDLVEHFDDAVQKAHRSRVVIVSPSLMMMAIQVIQTLVRDAAMRDQAHTIQSEVGKLLRDVRLIVERAGKLESHFRQAQEDLGQIAISADKVGRRAERIEAMDFAREEAPKVETLPQLRLARGRDL